MISWRVRQVLFLLMAAFVAYVEGFTNPFWIWNSVPIAASYLLLSRARQSDINPLPAIAFFVIACGTVLFAHAAWLYDWGGTATGSSTAGLMFVVLPVYASVLGGATFGLAILFGRRGA
jgi:hypothetical protein